jgi:hypothetical protein
MFCTWDSDFELKSPISGGFSLPLAGVWAAFLLKKPEVHFQLFSTFLSGIIVLI